MATLRDIAAEVLAVLMLFVLASIVYWALLAICGVGCAAAEKFVGIEPIAREGDINAVADQIEDVDRNQAGIANVQAAMKNEISLLRQQNSQIINNAIPREMWWVILVMLGLSNLDQVARWLPAIIKAIRGQRVPHPP